MPNQKDIAKALGVTQATVSRALRGDRAISEEMRQKVAETAKKIGYHQNAYLTMLMSNIRNGRTLSDKGVIGLLIEKSSMTEWLGVDTFRVFYQGVRQRAHELGFHVESFFLQQPGMDAEKIDRILQARGINGVILAPPYHGNRSLNLQWDRYAAVGVGFGWEEQELNRVAFGSFHNYIEAFNKLRKLGYRRIGTALSEQFIHGNRHGTRWYTGYLDRQDGIPAEERVPIFAGNLLPPEREKTAQFEPKFREWFSTWKPDALINLIADEMQWLDAMGVKVPQDLGLACLSISAEHPYAGIDEKSEVVGATALELVAAQIARNEFGPPTHPKLTLVEGRWKDGFSVLQQTPTAQTTQA
jgi:LacI family transcriptional regulator